MISERFLQQNSERGWLILRQGKLGDFLTKHKTISLPKKYFTIA